VKLVSDSTELCRASTTQSVTPARIGEKPNGGAHGNAGTRNDTRPLLLWLFVSTALIYLFTASSNFSSGDSFSELHVTDSMVTHAWFDVPVQKAGETCAGWGCQGTDGRFYSTHGIGYSVFMIPFYGLAQAEIHSVGAPHCGDPFWSRCVPIHLISWNTCVLTAGTVTLLALFGLELGSSLASALAAAFLYGLASMAWPYAKFGFDVTLTGLLVLAATREAVLAVDPRRQNAARWFRAGLFTALAVLVRLPTAPIAVPLAAASWLLGPRAPGERLKRMAAFVIPFMFAACISAWYNVVRFGSALDDGHSNNSADKLSSTPWSGLFGIAISPGKGLLWYSPIVVLAILCIPAFYKEHRAPCVVALSAAAISVVPYVFVNDWYGGSAWGPRFVMPVLPLILLPLLKLRSFMSRSPWGRFSALLIIALSVVVQISGVLVSYADRLAIAAHKGYAGDIFWNPRHSPIVDHIGTLVTYATNISFATHPVPQSQSFDLWWLNLWRIDGVPATASMSAGVLLALLAAAALCFMIARAKRVSALLASGTR
jgi:hypothetical protein